MNSLGYLEALFADWERRISELERRAGAPAPINSDLVQKKKREPSAVVGCDARAEIDRLAGAIEGVGLAAALEGALGVPVEIVPLKKATAKTGVDVVAAPEALKKRGRPSSGKPWVEAGVSRSAWFARKKGDGPK